MPSIYDIRAKGRNYCQTEGSEHYKASGNIEPAEMIISNGLAEDWILGNIIKCAMRFKKTQNLTDLKKVSDYAHILTGIKLGEGDCNQCIGASLYETNNPGSIKIVDKGELDNVRFK